MLKLEFATEKTFNEERNRMAKERRKLTKDTKLHYKHFHKLMNNDFHHVFATGFPFGTGR